MKLFEPGKIGRLSLKNRILMPPMLPLLIEAGAEGGYGQRAIDYHVARAKGGTGLIIVGAVRPNRKLEVIYLGDPVIDGKHCVHWINNLAEAVHVYGAKIGVCLSPGFGRVLAPDPTLPHGGLVSASAVPSKWDPNTICRALTTGEVEQLIEDVELSAKILSAAGIDLIELHAHNGYLIDQFLTPLWNKRTDKYGGSLNKRLRFSFELIEAVRRGAGADFPISYRYALTHYLDGGREIEEGLEIARRIEKAGVDIVGIDAGCYETNHWSQPTTTMAPGCLVPLAEMVKKVVDIPVSVVGKLGYPELAERVLQEGKADFIGLGRTLLADPEWPNKVKAGRLEDITPCLACHEGCLKRVFEGKHISCTVNPACGRERECTITPAEKKKSVVVIGGGPAGMEAARVAALRGHRVTLLEKGYTLGGNLIPASIPTFKQDYKLFLDYLTTQVKKLGVATKLGMEATPELVQQMNPDVVFVATGATHCIPDIPGIEKGMKKGKVVTGVDVLLGKKEVGKSVVVIGAGMVGCEVALYLAQQGKKVTAVECLTALRDMFFINALDLKDKLNSAKVKILENTDILEITKEGVVIADKRGEKSALEADTIVLAVGLQSNRELVEALQGKLPEVYAIGDCAESRRVLDAVWEGFHTGRLI